MEAAGTLFEEKISEKEANASTLFEEKLAAWESRADQRKQARPGHYIERERVVPIIEAYLADHDREHDTVTGCPGGWGENASARFVSAGAMETLSSMTGISARLLGRILGQDEPALRSRSASKCEWIEGSPKYLTIDLVDRLLTGMDLVYLFYLSPDEGGFADVYWHESIVGTAEALAA